MEEDFSIGHNRSHIFRPYTKSDLEECLALFDANCPEFFAPSERLDYEAFLALEPPGYKVVVAGDEMLGAFGFEAAANSSRGRLGWILVHPSAQRTGLGSQMLTEIRQEAEARSISVLDIAASHRSCTFFAHFGAVELQRTENGWGPGMHRVEMEWFLGEAREPPKERA
ncbi:MAG: GNAT family N-acetyltransferase [Deltaproteobacteria bacterium]|nr:GNAT family N-acetyltransferase [Deltaproteobacteria bacterium]